MKEGGKEGGRIKEDRAATNKKMKNELSTTRRNKMKWTGELKEYILLPEKLKN